MRALELKVPPPLVGAVCGVSLWLTAPTPHAASLASVGAIGALAMVVAALGLAIEIVAASGFFRAGTTVNPLTPARSSVLVTTGLHAWSRNPMYVGQLLLLAAWALWIGSPMGVLWLAAYGAYLTRFQIMPEERILAGLFGAEFEAYRARVRRWF